MIKTIVFDFDGVIVRNSEFGKDKAWEHILPKEVQEQVNIAKEKTRGGKGSRYDILREVLPLMNISPEKAQDWIEIKAKEFDDFTHAYTISDGILPEDKKAIEQLNQKYPLYINSGTPESVMPDLAKELDIEPFFKGIYGQHGNNSKIENLNRIINDSGCLPEEILFIGDQDTDYQASVDFGSSFVGITNDWNKWEKSKPFPIINMVKDLPDFLASFE